jgi:rhodanese-related sulfurtransferase
MPTDVGRDDVRRLVEGGALLVEVLGDDEYRSEHIAGAVNIPLEKLNAANVAAIERDRPVVVYCNDFQ